MVIRNRSLKQRAFTKNTHYFHSRKNNRFFWCETKLELDYCLYCEFDRAVLSYKTQPISFVYTRPDGSVGRYTPDMLVARGLTLEDLGFEEIKIERWTRHGRFKRAMSALRRHSLSRHSVPLNLVTDKSFRVGHRINNYELLYGYRDINLQTPDKQRFIKGLPPSLSFGDLKSEVEDAGFDPVIAWAIVAHQFYWFDETRKLTDLSPLEVQQ